MLLNLLDLLRNVEVQTITSMTLADERPNYMQCNIFNYRKNELPQIQSVGDIVYLQDMYVTQYKGATINSNFLLLS